MFEISVQAEFSAAHALVIKGEQEPLHGHNWLVTVTVAGAELDSDGLLCDFHLVERSLKRLLEGWDNRTLNGLGPFAPASPGGRAVNPTAENVARVIAQRLLADLDGRLAGRAAITSVRVTEAPGCAATYSPGSRTSP